jgi:hypothetical protein
MQAQTDTETDSESRINTGNKKKYEPPQLRCLVTETTSQRSGIGGDGGFGTFNGSSHS